MIEGFAELVLDEGKWFAGSILLSAFIVVALVGRTRRRGLSSRSVTSWAMNLYYGSMIGIMAVGHLLAVTVKLAQGTLVGSPWTNYPLGVALAVPAWCLVFGAERSVADEARWRKPTLALNACLAVLLTVFGLHNLPLVLPAILNMFYQLHRRRGVGWAILAAAVVVNLSLLAGALIFLASGQSFEQFRGM